MNTYDPSIPYREMCCTQIMTRILDALGYGAKQRRERELLKGEAMMWFNSPPFEALCDDLDLPAERIREKVIAGDIQPKELIAVFEQKLDVDAPKGA